MSKSQPWWENKRVRGSRWNPAPADSSPPLPRAEVAGWLNDTLHPGDLLLSGSRDSLSRLIRWGTMSGFSHTAMAVSNEQLIESYDWAGTPSEDDGGVGRLSVQRYAQRGSLLNLALLRPQGLDHREFDRVTGQATHYSVPFPSSTGVLLAFAGLGDHPYLRIPGARAYVEKRLHLLGDGAARVTCSEFAARVYLESGLGLRFQTLRLLCYIELLRGGETARLDDNTTPRLVDVSEDAKATPTTLIAFVAGFPQAVAASSKAQVAPDWVDLLMPGDFLQSSSFDVIAVRSVQK